MAKRLLLVELLAATLISAVIARSASTTPVHTLTPGAGEQEHHRQHSAPDHQHYRHHRDKSLAAIAFSEDDASVKIGKPHASSEHGSIEAHHRLRHHNARHSPHDHEKLGHHPRPTKEDGVYRSSDSKEVEFLKGESMIEFATVDPAEGYADGEGAHGNHSATGEDHSSGHGIHVASWRWDEIGIYFTFTLFIIVAGLAKVAFHHAHFISSRIPESCLLILLGTAVGGILYAAGVEHCEGIRGTTKIPGCNVTSNEKAFVFPTFTPQLFFLILLPPIILESSYSLYDRAFADNVGTVLFYAVIGTLLNTFLIGLALITLVAIGWIGPVRVASEDANPEQWWTGPLYTLQPTDCMVFSALISAVDPVAVLAIFQEVGINKDLYFLVFGESLLNDAVTVVLYTMMVAFADMNGNVSGEQYLLGIASFFTVSLGGLVIGVFYGLITALITRTTREVRVVEPLAVLGIAYLSFLSAELFHFSGIISMIGCGLVQAHYAFANVSRKSYTTVKYFIKMLSSTSDAVIFLFLGMVLIHDIHEWHWSFVLWILFLCLVARFIGVFSLTRVANRFRLKQINLQEQFLMAYGGLRGAVSFSLVEMLQPGVITPRQMFVTSTLTVILFTVFVQGATIKPLVGMLHIEKDSKKKQYLMNEMNETMFDHLTAGIEEICGHRGNNFFRERIEIFDEKYLKPVFSRNTDKNSLQRLFEKLTTEEYAANLYTGALTPIPSTVKMEDTVPEEGEEYSEMGPLPVKTTVPSTPPTSRANAQASTESSVELSPLITQVTFDGQTVRPTPKPRGRYPLIRQQSAPSDSFFSRTGGRQQSLDSGSNLPEFPNVELRKKGNERKSRPNSGESGSSGALDPEATASAFRKALRSSRSSQYKGAYQKHNLIGDDDVPVELEMVLRRRLSVSQVNSGRRSQNPSVFNSPLTSPNSPSPPKTPNSRLSAPEGATHFPYFVNTENHQVTRPSVLKRDGRSSAPPAKTGRLSQPPNSESAMAENERHAALLASRRQRLDSLRQMTFGLNVIAERDGEQSSSNLQIMDLENTEEDGTRMNNIERKTLSESGGESQEDDRNNFIMISEPSNVAQPKTLSRETGV